MSLFLFVYLILFSFSLSQNFIYDPDDWTAFTQVEVVSSISENDNFVLFGTNNGIHSFNKDSEQFFYDFHPFRE